VGAAGSIERERDMTAVTDSDIKEFERDMLSHLPALMGVATRLTRNQSEAEDVVQDTLVKALRARDQYNAGTNLRAWLLKILRNTFINRYRRGGLERSVLDGASAAPLVDGWTGAATVQAMRDPESQLLRPVLEQEISRAIDALPEDFRMAVLMADVEEFSYKEIADAMDCPVGTVMSRLHRGRRLLKEQLYKQAQSLGILAAPTRGASAPEASGPEAETVSLNQYRERRSAKKAVP